MYNRSKNLMKFVDDYVLVDIETTGLSPINDDRRLVELRWQI